jgi:hypothetical protein
MRKKTALPPQQHPTTSGAGQGKDGLIARGETAPQSERENCALDNRSHRTLELRGAGLSES